MFDNFWKKMSITALVTTTLSIALLFSYDWNERSKQTEQLRSAIESYYMEVGPKMVSKAVEASELFPMQEHYRLIGRLSALNWSYEIKKPSEDTYRKIFSSVLTASKKSEWSQYRMSGDEKNDLSALGQAFDAMTYPNGTLTWEELVKKKKKFKQAKEVLEWLVRPYQHLT